MKKLTIAFLLCSTLLFSACSTDKKAESTDLTAKPSSTLKRTDESKKKKAAEEKRISEEAEKKKQEEISKKVLEADTAMKAAETNPTDETVAAAKRLVEAVPGGNDELQKRLETVSAKLESIKQLKLINSKSNKTRQRNRSLPIQVQISSMPTEMDLMIVLFLTTRPHVLSMLEVKRKSNDSGNKVSNGKMMQLLK